MGLCIKMKIVLKVQKEKISFRLDSNPGLVADASYVTNTPHVPLSRFEGQKTS